MNKYHIDSTDPQALNDLVMSLIRSEEVEYTVINEFDDDITDEIEKLKSLKIRSLLKKK